MRATVRYLHTSPYKVRQVLELVRGLPVGDAERLLATVREGRGRRRAEAARTPRSPTPSTTTQLPADELFVARAWADEGPTRKHGQPRARGRYFRIRKRTSHVTIVLERFALDELEERQRREEATGRGAAVAQRRRAERVRRSRAPSRSRAEEPEVEDDECVDEPEVAEVVEPTKSDRRRRPSAEVESRARKLRRNSHGSESQPVRIPARHHHRVEVALDRGQEGVPRVPHRGLEDPRLPAQAARARGRQPRSRSSAPATACASTCTPLVPAS